jgi:3-deoxy-D-manno-octulosonate 8-phosphate phosphatase (KDO 8-P phosphatase)
MNGALLSRAKHVKLVVLDVDGVMTNGSLIYTGRGEQTKQFSVSDGLGIKLLMKTGVRIAVITGRASPALTKRLNDLEVDHRYFGIDDKLTTFKRLLKKLKLNPSEVCCIGDDLPDLAMLKLSGFSVSPPDAPRYIKDQVTYVTKATAGFGVVREIAEIILRAQGNWTKILESFS